MKNTLENNSKPQEYEIAFPYREEKCEKYKPRDYISQGVSTKIYKDNIVELTAGRRDREIV